MSLIDILFNAAGGGILGSALHCVTDWIDTKNKIAMMRAQVDMAEKTEAWKAFTSSQEGGQSLQIPANATPWVINLYLCVDALKQATRPLLTWAAIAIIAGVYAQATPEARTAMGPEIIFGSFTAIFWWFGARYSRSNK
jgi:heme A synthase